MRLSEDEARARLVAHDHGVFSTLHAQRGPDAVPVVFAATDDLIGIPVDRVKSKTSTRLQRERNLEGDPRATLLVEHWDRTEWSRLWWVRADLRWEPEASSTDLEHLLRRKYPQYGDVEGAIAHVLVLRIVGFTGWAAAGE